MLKRINTYSLIFSEGPESGLGLAGCLCFNVSFKSLIKIVAQGSDLPESSTEERSSSVFTHVVVGRIQPISCSSLD